MYMGFFSIYRIFLRHSNDFAGLEVTATTHKGVEVKKISAILGHSSVKITYDTYIHLWKGALDTATDVLDETFKLDDNFGMKS